MKELEMKKIHPVRVESFFREAMLSKVAHHGVMVQGEKFVLLPVYSGFEFKDGNLRLLESAKEYGGGKSRRIVTIYFKGKEVWKWVQDISIGKESWFLTYVRLRNLAIGFFLNREGRDTYFPDEGTGIGYESVDICNRRSTFGRFYYREAIITISDPKSMKSLNEMRMLCISFGGFTAS
jgi:hypothetical protein